jgi:adenylate cyclase class 2
MPFLLKKHEGVFMPNQRTFELELKAWAAGPQGIQERLESFAVYIEEFRREDVYWFPSAGAHSPQADFPRSGIRIRKEWTRDAHGREAEAVRITYKFKEVRERIEVNDERELLLAPPVWAGAEHLEELFRLLRLEPRAAKVKQGRAWRYGDVRAELCQVEGLGWFVEMEILAERDDEETCEAARAQLLELLDKTGVERGKIETRYYTELLREAALTVCPADHPLE